MENQLLKLLPFDSLTLKVSSRPHGEDICASILIYLCSSVCSQSFTDAQQFKTAFEDAQTKNASAKGGLSESDAPPAEGGVTEEKETPAQTDAPSTEEKKEEKKDEEKKDEEKKE